MRPTSGSKIVMIFKSELVPSITLSMRIYLKIRDRELVSELKGDLATLRQQALEPPTRSRRDHPGTDTGSGSRPVTGDFVAVPTPPAFEQADYPKVPFWTRKEWDTFVERSKLANKNPPWNAFLTDENGDALLKHRYNELWTDAKLAFNSLYYRRFDPTSWSKKTDLAAAYFYNTISAKYPEFRLCEGNWKIHVWTTERYPDWVKNVRKGGGLQRSYLHSMVPSMLIISARCRSIYHHGRSKAASPYAPKRYKTIQETPAIQERRHQTRDASRSAASGQDQYRRSYYY